ncbi:MAG: hypothetical protein HZA90_16820 [Verrucomicrobia bacterium]|nr:hypothetical protein [Verrucomicrobiota bacterium]
MASQVDALVLSKSLALVEKTKRQVAQIDTAEFPTSSSLVARNLLLAALGSLGNEAHWQAMSPEALYRALIQMQRLVGEVEASTSDRISWPLVSYCDHFWRLLFPSDDTQIFYSLFEEHNYGIRSFSRRLMLLLETVLPPPEVTRILGGKEIYCLQISSLEDENLPLYANIGHEFGHALYWAKEQQIWSILAAECDAVFKAIRSSLVAQEAGSAGRRASRCAWVIMAIATELFADLVGALIAGPAFLLSLHEMGWGADQNSWSIALSPKDSNTHAYPSFAFRLSCVQGTVRLDAFDRDLRHKFDAMPNEKDLLKTIPQHLTGIPVAHQADHISARPVGDGDAKALQQAAEKALPDLKQGLRRFVDRCNKEVLTQFQNHPEFSAVSGEQVFELIRRLDADILPNIIPDGTLLGIPASFGTILNASALFRMHVLSARDGGSVGSKEIHRRVQKVEQLTAKALEVSYVQREFRSWESTRNV